MRPAWKTWAAWSLWTLTLAVGVAAIVLYTVTDHQNVHASYTVNAPALVAALFTFQAFATVGALIVSRRPRNPIGWIFCVAALLCQLGNVADDWSRFAFQHGVSGAVAPLVVLSPLWGVGVALIAVFGFQLFPDGIPLTPRWRALTWVSATALVVLTVASVLTPGRVENGSGFDNPVGVTGMGVVAGAAWGCLVVFLVLSVFTLVLRLRRSAGVERQQAKLVVWTVCFVVLFSVALVVLHENTGALAFLGSNSDVVWLFSVSLIPISVGVSILRYRLYEIDRVISRTLVYGALTVILGAAYAGLVLGGQAVFSSFAGGSNLAIAVSTLVVAALFLPVRSRVQGFVDRRFYRRRYDAQRTLEAFGARLREQVDLDALGADLSAVVGETMQPAHVSLWLRGTSR